MDRLKTRRRKSLTDRDNEDVYCIDQESELGKSVNRTDEDEDDDERKKIHNKNVEELDSHTSRIKLDVNMNKKR